jgi:2-hydroxychromene-2-carboxylate isomerase
MDILSNTDIPVPRMRWLEQDLSVIGAPFFITDTDERFWGQDRLDDLDRHLAGDF